MADPKCSPPAWQSHESFDPWRSVFDPAPPAYHSLVSTEPTADAGNATDSFSSCCAFERLNAITHPSNHHGFHRTPQLRLIGWMVLCRAIDDSLSLEQRFSCPLASCHAQFAENEHMQLVNHVSACSHLAEGEYLCPYHGTVENFMTPTAPCHSHRASKRHFLKRTIGKICRLGSRRHSPVGDIKVEPGDNEFDGRHTHLTSANKRPRLDQISAPIVSQPIVHAPVFSARMAATVSQSLLPAGPSPVELSANEISELEGWVGPTLTEPPCLRYQELPAAEHMPQEMCTAANDPAIWDAGDNRFSNSSWASVSDSVFTTDNTLSPVSPISRDSYFSMDGFDCPLSEADTVQYTHTPVNNPFKQPPTVRDHNPQVERLINLCLGAQAPPNIPPPVERKSPRPIPSIRVDTSFNTTATRSLQTSPLSSSNSSFDSPVSDASDARDSATFFDNNHVEVKNPQSLVAELRGLFNTLFKVSLRKLCSDPNNNTGQQLLNWNTSPAALFERGMRALQKVVNGEMPNDFMGIFGMSLLTYACGLADVDFNMPEQFEEIFAEQLRWSCAIEDHSERDLYTDLIHQLWAPREKLRKPWCDEEHENNDGLDSKQQTCQEFSWDANLLNISGLGASTSNQRPSSAKLNGAAIGLCQRFLDNFEYLLVDLNELNMDVQATPDFGLALPADFADPSTMNHEILMANIIRPLASNPALQSFMSVVEKASLLLETFPNMPLRNTELSLMQEGKEHPTPALLRQAFTAEVQRLSSNASNALGCGTTYRAYYYSRDIDQVLALHSDLLAVESSQSRSRSSSLGSAKGKRPMQRPHSQFNSQPFSPGASKFAHSPTSSQFSNGSLPSTPRRPWSVEVAVSGSREGSGGGSPSVSPIGFLHSRNNSNEEMLPFLQDPIGLGAEELHGAAEVLMNGTINPAQILNIHSVPSVPPSRATSRGTKPMPRSVRRKKAAASLPTSFPTILATAPHPSSSSIISATGSSTQLPSNLEKATSSCTICGQRFEGKAQWIRANVTRHVREKHRGTAKRLQCSEPKCRYSSTRRGNVDHHRRTVHGLEC